MVTMDAVHSEAVILIFFVVAHIVCAVADPEGVQEVHSNLHDRNAS